MSKYKVGDAVLFKSTVRQVECDTEHKILIEMDGGGWCLTKEDNIVDASKTYEHGLADAWKVLAHIQSGELSSKEIMDIWGMTDLTFVNCFAQKYKPQEAIKILEAYEKSQQIQVGDIVKHINCDDEYIVFDVENGSVLSTDLKRAERLSLDGGIWKKTGKHIDIEHLLKQIRGNE